MKGSRSDDVEGVRFRVKHGEAVVMLGGDDDVLHASGLGEGHNIVRIEAGGVKHGREGLIVRDCNGGVVHNPLADSRDLLAIPGAGWYRVETPVDEHAKAGFAPPLHASVALAGSFSVLNGGDWMTNRLCIRLAVLQLRITQGSGSDEEGDDSNAARR